MLIYYEVTLNIHYGKNKYLPVLLKLVLVCPLVVSSKNYKNDIAFEMLNDCKTIGLRYRKLRRHFKVTP